MCLGSLNKSKICFMNVYEIGFQLIVNDQYSYILHN